MRDDFTVTLSRYYEPVPTPDLTPAEYARVLGRPHAGLRQLDTPASHFTDRVGRARGSGKFQTGFVRNPRYGGKSRSSSYRTRPVRSTVLRAIDGIASGEVPDDAAHEVRFLRQYADFGDDSDATSLQQDARITRGTVPAALRVSNDDLLPVVTAQSRDVPAEITAPTARMILVHTAGGSASRC